MMAGFLFGFFLSLFRDCYRQSNRTSFVYIEAMMSWVYLLCLATITDAEIVRVLQCAVHQSCGMRLSHIVVEVQLCRHGKINHEEFRITITRISDICKQFKHA